ncbi:hypothetical protein Tco_0650146 [Tanacetum coccineum]
MKGHGGTQLLRVKNFCARFSEDAFEQLSHSLIMSWEDIPKYNPYLDISRIFSNARTDKGETIGDEPGLVRAEDDDIGY